MKWDFFISHADEDKKDAVLPLAEGLRRAGFRVWLDVLELKIGDSLQAKIDEGLTRSQFGIVVLSKAFFRKRWTSAELGGLFALEESGHTRILPLWHGVDEAMVARHSPLLASRVAVSMTEGVFQVVQRIINDLGDRLDRSKTAHIQLCELLVQGVKVELADFLAAHPYQLGYATRLLGSGCLEVALRPDLSPVIYNIPDLVLSRFEPSLEETRRVVLALGPTDLSASSRETWLPDVRRLIQDTESVAELFPHSGRYRTKSIVAIGRRHHLSVSQRRTLRSTISRTMIRTYDWLVDAFLNAGSQPRYFSASVTSGSRL